MSDANNQCLRGKTIIVTGAGRGIGRGIALLAAHHGANVVANDVGASGWGDGSDQAPASLVVGEIRSAGGVAIANFESVASWDGAHRLAEAAIAEFGSIDGIVNNAGILRDAIFHKMSEADFDSVVDVNLKGPFNVSRAAMPHLRARGGGAMVHMSSASGLIGNFGQVNYAAAKAGVMGLSKGIALDGAKFGVRSNCVVPFAWSRLTGSIPATSTKEKARVEKLQRMAPETIAPMVIFLLSDEAKEVSGQVFAVRMNEIFLLSQPRPLRSVHSGTGWTPESISSHALPALKQSLLPLDRSADVFSWDPV